MLCGECALLFQLSISVKKLVLTFLFSKTTGQDLIGHNVFEVEGLDSIQRYSSSKDLAEH